MEPQPDYGEASYRGSNKLKDKKTVITSTDSGIGRAVALAFAREELTFSSPISMNTMTPMRPSASFVKRQVESACW